MSNSAKPFRYPGTHPFSAEQRNIFHGRTQETDDLIRMIRFQQTVVLYGKSGMGKSSLLNAAVIPLLQEKGIARVYTIRFNAWTGDPAQESPLKKALGLLTPADPGQLKPLFAEPSLWAAARVQQISETGKRLLLVFDQFEELFTYPDAQIQALKLELAEMLRAGLPQRFEKTVQNLQLPEAVLDQFYDAPEVKAVFAIRSDRLHLLDQLSALLPNILKYGYELQAITSENARTAIEKPANAEGNFASPRFRYEEEALKNILRFLRDDAGRIEAIQLQTLCSAFERRIIAGEKPLVAGSDTGEEALKAIIDNYYEERINDPQVMDPATARRILEDDLVIETEGNKGVRVTLHELSLFSKYAVPGEKNAAGSARFHLLLDALVNVHLLRREVGSRGGDMYELAHDRLIEAVLKHKHARLAEERRLAEEQENLRREQEVADLKQKAEAERKRAEKEEALRVEADGLRQKAVEAQRNAEAARQIAETNARRARIGFIIAVLLALLASALGFFAYEQQKNAVESLGNFKKVRVQLLLTDAQTYMDSRDYRLALEKLEEVLKMDAQNQTASEKIKTCQEALNYKPDRE